MRKFLAAALLLLSGAANAQIITINENLDTSSGTFNFNTNNPLLSVGTFTYTGSVPGTVLFVGSNAVVGTGTGASNQIVLYATGSIMLNGQSVSIGETGYYANSKTFGSTVTIQGNAFSVGGSTFSISAAGISAYKSTFTILSNGNVGIGTTSPAATLDVYGDIIGSGVPWGDCVATYGATVTGWSTSMNNMTWCKKVGKTVIYSLNLSGTNNSTSVSITFPWVSISGAGYFGAAVAQAYNNSAAVTTPTACAQQEGTATLTCYPCAAISACSWTATGTKSIIANGSYQVP
jgi:hypothetical protein